MGGLVIGDPPQLPAAPRRSRRRGIGDDDEEPRFGYAVAVPPLLLNVHQVGAMLGGISERKIRGMISAGQFPPPVRIGTLVRWRPADVQRWADSLKT